MTLISKKKQALKRFDEGAFRGVALVAQDLKARSVQLAPIDSGDLRGSGSVDPEEGARITDQTVEATVGFGTEYALRQHEDLNLSHPNGGEAKFLERPARANSKRYQDFIKKKIAEAMR